MARATGMGTAKGIRGASLGRRPAKPVGQVALAFRPAKELRYGGPVGRGRLKRAIELPVTPGYDHAEGIAPVEVGGATRLMVVYDSPAPERVDERENTVTTELFEMP